MPEQRAATASDVVVIGGGIAGKAVSLHLARGGMTVICIDPMHSERPAVGESLDWSTPELLKELGLPTERILSENIGTQKRHVVLRLPCGTPEHYSPIPWLGKAPFHVELGTLHVDRSQLDRELLNKVAESGVTLVQDRVARVERDGECVSSVHTESGEVVESPWFVDATGFATSLFAREFKLRADCAGPIKIAMWTYFPVSDATFTSRNLSRGSCAASSKRHSRPKEQTGPVLASRK